MHRYKDFRDHSFRKLSLALTSTEVYPNPTLSIELSPPLHHGLHGFSQDWKRKTARSASISGCTSLSPNVYTTLTNLQFDFKFIFRFIRGECTFFSNEVENHFVVTVVAYTTTNQLRIPHHPSYVWPVLKRQVPLAFNPVHFFLLKCSSDPRLVEDINHGFEQQVKETLLLLG
jgi:hypothetical protein